MGPVGCSFDKINVIFGLLTEEGIEILRPRRGLTLITNERLKMKGSLFPLIYDVHDSDDEGSPGRW